MGNGPVGVFFVLAVYFAIYTAMFVTEGSSSGVDFVPEDAPPPPITDPEPVGRNNTEDQEDDDCSWYSFLWCTAPKAIGDFFSGIWAGIKAVFAWLGSFFSGVWSVVTFAWGFLTFNIPGAPTWIRVPVAIAINGSLGWSVASLIRGGS